MIKILAFISLLILASCQSNAVYVPGEVVTTYSCNSDCTIAVVFEGNLWTIGRIDNPVEVGDTVYKACYYKSQTTLGCSSNFISYKTNEGRNER